MQKKKKIPRNPVFEILLGTLKSCRLALTDIYLDIEHERTPVSVNARHSLHDKSGPNTYEHCQNSAIFQIQEHKNR